MEINDIQQIQHIKKHCEDVACFIDRFGNNFDVFANDAAFYKAVSISIFQISELSNGLSNEFRESSAARVPWGLIRGAKCWIADAYNRLDKDIVWEVATLDIPKLKEFCDEVLIQYNANKLGLSVRRFRDREDER